MRINMKILPTFAANPTSDAEFALERVRSHVDSTPIRNLFALRTKNFFFKRRYELNNEDHAKSKM